MVAAPLRPSGLGRQLRPDALGEPGRLGFRFARRWARFADCSYRREATRSRSPIENAFRACSNSVTNSGLWRNEFNARSKSSEATVADLSTSAACAPYPPATWPTTRSYAATGANAGDFVPRPPASCHEYEPGA